IAVTQCRFKGCGFGVFAWATALLGNGDGSFQPPANYSVGVYQNSVPTEPSWIAGGDVDGDGYVDIVVLNDCNQFGGCDARGQGANGSVRPPRGNGDGTLQAPALFPAAGNIPTTVAVADVSGDGKPDILLTTSVTVGVLLNQTPRAATTTTLGAQPDPSTYGQ